MTEGVDVEGGHNASERAPLMNDHAPLVYAAPRERALSKDSEVASVCLSSHQDRASRKMSNLKDSFINSVNTLLGVGVLSLPFAFAKGGWMTLPLTILISMWACYTAYLLGKVQKDIMKVTAAANGDPEASGFYKRRRGRDGKPVNGRCFRKISGERVWEVMWCPAAAADETPGWKIYYAPAATSEGGCDDKSEADSALESVWEQEALVQHPSQPQVQRLDRYPDLGFAAFGRAGYIGVQVLFYGEITLFAISMIVLAVSNLTFLTDTPSRVWLSVIYGAAAMPQGFIRDFSMLSFLSYFGFFAVLVVLASVMYFGFSTARSPGSILHPHEGLETFKPCSIALSFSLVMGCYGGHSLFPSLRADMAHPTKYPGIAFLTFLVCAVYYSLCGTFGYLMYGPDVKDVVTQNFDPDSPITTAIAACIVAVCYSKHGLAANVWSTSVEETLVRCGAPDSWALYFPVRFIFTVVCVVTSLLFPSFDKAMGLVGAAACALVSLAFPLSAYLALFYQDIGCLRILINAALLLLSLYFAVTGTLSTLGTDIC